MSSPTPPPPRVSGLLRALIGFGVISATGAITLGLAIGLSPMGFLRTTNVGDLAELASFQEQLRPLNACELEYGPHSRRHSQYSYTSVTVTPCGFDTTRRSVYVRVPPEMRPSGHIAFDLKRSSTSDPWKVLVVKDEVSFPQLKQTLEQLAPLIITEFPAQQQQDIDDRARWDHERKQRADTERARKEAASESYPK
ncbi:hypothetical protein JGU66_27265 [Myxococcaceae bacterium JPH2]|nr:hypothetical protein [Myxococcaceae bacterium JPH2]